MIRKIDAIETVDVFGVPLSVLSSYSQAVDWILGRVKEQKRTFCVAINPEKIQRTGSDPELLGLLRQAELHICDGIGAAVAARLLHGKRVGRITGIQLFLHLVAAAEQHQLPVFLLGASGDSNQGACRRLLELHPRLNVAGSQDGFFQDDRQVVEQINRSGAQMVFVAMGSPRQERWITAHRRHLTAPLCMGVGGSFDVLSGHAIWAPEICRRTGTEFLYRLVRDPRRWRRQLCLPVFAARVVSQTLKQAVLSPTTSSRS